MDEMLETYLQRPKLYVSTACFKTTILLLKAFLRNFYARGGMILSNLFT